MSLSEVAAAAVRPPSILALATITAVGSLAIHITVPAVPVIERDLGIDYAAAQLTVTVYLFATGVGQLIIGPISDALGRRPVLLAGLALYVVGSLVSALAWSIDVLVVTRFLQGLGGCTGLVLGRAIIRDVHARDRAASAIAYVTTVMVLATMSAAPLGGVLADALGWRGIFWILAVFGAAVLVFALTQVPETKLTQRVPFRLGPLAATFGQLLGYRAFVAYTLTVTFCAASFFTFIGGGPHVIMNLMGHSSTEFGLGFMSAASCFVIGNFISARLAERVGTDRLMLAGCVGIAIGNLLLMYFATLGPMNIFTLCGAMAVMTLAFGLVMANATANMVSVRPDLAGSAAGLGGCIQFSFGSLVSVAIALLASSSALPLAIQLFVFGTLTVVSFLVARRAPVPRAA